ncbi:MAG TPA: peptidoglycan-binding protein [Devosia sp.]|nr:peptidoglycan-binding protein [Devosia sp.]
MARAYQQSLPTESGADWQTLRGELAALLDQVESQVARNQPAYAPPPQPDRHRDALRSVQRAVDRFSEREEAPASNARDGLQSAIDQIRSRQGAMPAPRMAAASPVPRGEEFVAAMGGVVTRLERIENEIKGGGRSGADIKAVGEQVAQLAHVVELLAGAVGETGQVKRIEGQIASLARLVAQNQNIDVAELTTRLEGQIASIGRIVTQSREADVKTLTGRLDDMSTAVGRLADLQVQFANKADNPAHVAAFRDGMELIESSVRNIYDRIDSLERSGGMAPADIERLTGQMSQFIDAMKDPAAPQGLVELIDALNMRISELESGDRILAPLRKDLVSLRDAVTVSLEPRFDALERKLDALVPSTSDFSGINLQLEELNARIAERPIDNGIGQLEAQVRQLVARMDQTGEQLSGLAKLYTTNETMPDFDRLADLVASKTSAAMMGVEAASGLSQAALDGLEQRITALIQSLAPGVATAPAMTPEETGERLAALEASLLERRFAVPAEDEEAIAGEAAYAAPQGIHADEPASEPEMFEAPKPAMSDSMPKDPAEDAPLTPTPFPDPSPVSNAASAQRRLHPGLEPDLSLASRYDAPPAPPAMEPTTLPPAPRPSAGFFDAGPITAPPEPEPAPVAASSRNTFIEAHRRAVQKQQQQAVKPPPASNSLIGRALARFQAANNGDFTKSEPAPARVLAGDKPVPAEWIPEPSPMAEPVLVREAAHDEAEAHLETAETDAPKESFLARNRKIILLGAALVALAFLTYNLVMQRVASSSAPAEDPATTGSIDVSQLPLAPTPVETSVPETTPPRVIPMVDSLSTGSASPVAIGFAASTPQQKMPAAFEASTEVATTETARIEPLISTPSPVKVELAPEAIGPIELREAAANGDARAQFEVAAIYTEGRAVPQDYKQAAVWYERSAAQGFAPSQYRLGTLYENGDGLDKDLEAARLWYERAAEGGNRMSMHNLAALYASGGLGKQQFDSAAKWFEEAASRGLTDSQFNLGMLYARGLGVKQSLEQSFKWFGIAALSGDKDAAKARDDIARSLGAEEVGKLTAEVAAFKPAPIDLAANFAPIGTWSKKFDPGETIAAKDIVASVQAALTRLGYDVGVPDGVSGPKTSDAIKAFERATGMSEIGLINPRLLAVLGSQPV